MASGNAGLTRWKFNSYEKVTSARLQACADLLSASVCDILGKLFAARDLVPPVGVVEGFLVTTTGATMEADVGGGLALCSLGTPTLGDFSGSRTGLIFNRGTRVIAFSPGSAQDRIDVVYLESAEADGNPASVQVYDPGSQTFSGLAKDLEIRNTPTYAIAEGTPAPSPSAPSVPFRSVKIAEVLIPASATDLSGATLTDARVVLGRAGMAGIEQAEASGLVVAFGGSITSQKTVGTGTVTRASAGVYDIPLTNPIRDLSGAIIHATVQGSTPAVVSAGFLSTSAARVYVTDHAGSPLDRNFAFRVAFVRDSN